MLASNKITRKEERETTRCASRNRVYSSAAFSAARKQRSCSVPSPPPTPTCRRWLKFTRILKFDYTVFFSLFSLFSFPKQSRKGERARQRAIIELDRYPRLHFTGIMIAVNVSGKIYGDDTRKGKRKHNGLNNPHCRGRVNAFANRVARLILRKRVSIQNTKLRP